MLDTSIRYSDSLHDLTPNRSITGAIHQSKSFSSSIKTAKFAVLISDGVNETLFMRTLHAAERGGLDVDFIAPAGGPVRTSSGNPISITLHLENASPLDYVAVILVTGTQLEKTPLQKDGISTFLKQMHSKGKLIAYAEGSSKLLNLADIRTTTDRKLLRIDCCDFETRFAGLCRKFYSHND